MIINTTPHDVVLYADDMKTVLHTFKKSEWDCRLDINEQKHIKDIPFKNLKIPVFSPMVPTKMVMKKNGEEVKTWSEDSTFIVSQMVKDFVLAHAPEYADFFLVPDTNIGAVRQEGKIIGTMRLLQ
jgi:hypothetical protein